MVHDIQYDACKVAHSECVRTDKTTKGGDCQEEKHHCNQPHNPEMARIQIS